MFKRILLLLSIVTLAGILGGCDAGLTTISATSGSPGSSSGGSPGAMCATSDQDQYVYHPDRLHVVQSCLRVSGVVAAVRDEADGDIHILLHLLQPANQNKQGDLVVEPVCVGEVSQQDAVATCAADREPYTATLPAVGDHVWMEGRYVYDNDHGGWAELHPLYRSEVAAP